MYNGWFCLGGTEIVNNMRAMGYARTASQLTNRWGLPELGRPEEIVATNLYTNPSFETASGTVEVRRNYHKYPGSGASGFTGWGGYRSVITNPGGYVRGTVNEAAGPMAAGVTAPIATVYYVPVAPGEQVSLSTELRGTKQACIGLQYYDAAGVIVGGSQQTGSVVPAGSWQVSTLSVTIPAGVAFIRPVNFFTEAVVIGDTLDLRKWTAEKTVVPMGTPFDGNYRPTVRRNLAVNPRVTASGLGWSSNSGSAYLVTRGVPVPAPHPLGIETAVECSTTGLNSTLVSMYNTDGLGNSGTPQRMSGVWVYITEPGYRMQAGASGLTWPTDELPVNEWVYVKTLTPTAAGGYSTVYIQKISGNASTTVRAWVTGLQVEAGSTPVGDYMDGEIGAPRGYATMWNGTPLISASQMYDNDFTVAWLGGENSSESVLRGEGAAGVATQSGVAAIRSAHWSMSGGYSLRLIPKRSTTSVNYAGIILPVPLGAEGTILVTGRQDAPLSSPLWGSRGRPYVLNPTQSSPTIAPNEAAVTAHRLNYSPLTSTNLLVLPHGGTTGSGDVWYDNVAILEGGYRGDWFDGSFSPNPNYLPSWTGTPNASASLLTDPGTPDEWPNYCNINWFDNPEECTSLFAALNDAWLPDSAPIPWEAASIREDAPWASTSVYEVAEKFMGVYAIDVAQLSDSTREVSTVEGITPGGVLGRSRLAVPRFRFRVLLTALDGDGLEYGQAWLSRALSEQSCSSHGPSCGSTDLTFFTDCPPDPEAFVGTYGASDPGIVYDLMTRQFHDVKCVAGPVVVEEIIGRSPNTVGRIVEFDLEAGVPNLFGKFGLQEGSLDPAFSTIVTDVPRNSIPTPSAELAGAAVVVATNYSTNPSVETNATGWSTSSNAVTGSGAVAGARVTGLAAVGTAAYRARMTASAAATPTGAYIQADQLVMLPVGAPAGTRYSVNLWATALVSAGVASITGIEIYAAWRSGSTVLRTDLIGAMPATGGARSLAGIAPPAGADRVSVYARANLTSWNATAIVDLYADALAVTVP
jgi:hypothetical protein